MMISQNKGAIEEHNRDVERDTRLVQPVVKVILK